MINEKINKSFLNIISPPSFNKNLATTQLSNVPKKNYNTIHQSIQSQLIYFKIPFLYN